MIVEMYSVHDKQVGAFLPAFSARAKGEAIRMFYDACKQNERFRDHAADYTLYFVGHWDDVAGRFTAVDPDRVLSAQEVLGIYGQSLS